VNSVVVVVVLCVATAVFPDKENLTCWTTFFRITITFPSPRRLCSENPESVGVWVVYLPSLIPHIFSDRSFVPFAGQFPISMANIQYPTPASRCSGQGRLVNVNSPFTVVMDRMHSRSTRRRHPTILLPPAQHPLAALQQSDCLAFADGA